MASIHHLVENNRLWAARMRAADPDYFRRLEAQQAPGYLWIGCSDSRVPATQITDLAPGEMFVHRNVANLVQESDRNCMAVLEFAVEALGVAHIIVCGHYGCGGVKAALEDEPEGEVGHWLRGLTSVRDLHAESLAACAAGEQRRRRLAELNVIEQAARVCRSAPVQAAWSREDRLGVHGLIYGIGDGILREVMTGIDGPGGLDEAYRTALAALG
jgi:carbonic anhydrase